ncbi:MAG TPA: hypothetical protein VFI32_11930 [Rhodanobacteraceae bacterium]|nr:hypothetical protein [Rhodanobacteraceae bacterium]
MSHAARDAEAAHTGCALQRAAPGGEEIEMFELGILVLVVVGACWLFGALIAGLFKLTFGLIGALFGGLFGLFFVGLAALLVVPIVLLALLPLMLPALCIAALVWLIVRASRPDPCATKAPASH